MCGLVGFSGISPDINALKILGIYNDTRGGDACGFAINNKIFKSAHYDLDKFSKLFTKKEGQEKFIKNNNKNQIILMHTRKGSAGGRTSEQAHPCKVKNSKGRELIGIHNGTIRNIDDLVEKYLSKSDIVFEHSDTDSLKLYTILCETGNYDVLTEYEGGAALLWYYLDEPTTLYAFKGASESYSYNHISYGKIEEERPLFWGKLDNSLYFSSIQDSLFAINIEEVYSLSDNKVFTIKNGKFDSNVKINRISPYYTPTPRKSLSSGNVHGGASKNDILKSYYRVDMQEVERELIEKKSGLSGSFYLDEFMYCQTGSPMSGVYYLYYDYNENYISASEVESIVYLNIKDLVNYSKLSTLNEFLDAFNEYSKDKSKKSEALHAGTYALFFSGMLLDTDKIKDLSKYIVNSYKKGLTVINRLKVNQPFYWLDNIMTLKDADLNELKSISAATKEPIIINSSNVYHKENIVSKDFSYSLIPEVKVKMDNTKIAEVTDFQMENGTTFTPDELKKPEIKFQPGDSVLLNIERAYPGYSSKKKWVECKVHTVNKSIGTVTVKFDLELKVGKNNITYLAVTDLNNLILVDEDSEYQIGDTVYYYDSLIDEFKKAEVKSLANNGTIGISFTDETYTITYFKDLANILSEEAYEEMMEDVPFKETSEIEIGSTVYDVGNYDLLEVLKINISNKGNYLYRVYNKRTKEILDLESKDFIKEPLFGNSSIRTFKQGDTVYHKKTKIRWKIIREINEEKVYIKRPVWTGGFVFQTIEVKNLLTEKEYIENEFEPNSDFKSDWLGILNAKILQNLPIQKKLTGLEVVEQFQNKKIDIEKMTDLVNKLEKNKNAINSILNDNKDTELPQILIDKMEDIAKCMAKLEDFVETGKNILEKTKEMTNV